MASSISLLQLTFPGSCQDLHFGNPGVFLLNPSKIGLELKNKPRRWKDAQWFRALVLPEDLSAVPSTVWPLTTICKSRYREADAF